MAALLLTATAAPQAPARKKAPADWAKIEKYAADNDSVAKADNDGRRTVFIGNSITEFWGSKRPQFWKSHGYICRGISGQTSYQFLVRFRQDVISLNPAPHAHEGRRAGSCYAQQFRLRP